jgi:hypothetical protein
MFANTFCDMASPTKQLADRLLADQGVAGGVDQFTVEKRSVGWSWRRIALAMRDATAGAIDVTPETVRGWALVAQDEVARAEQVPA